jgi:hypothetical protein
VLDDQLNQAGGRARLCCVPDHPAWSCFLGPR